MLDFTPTEKRGLIITIVVIVMAAIIQWTRPYFYYQENINYSQPDSIFYRSSRMSSAAIFPERVTSNKTIDPKKNRSSAPALASVDLNHATKSELEKLPRIGPKTAERIIKFRDEQNGFRTNEDLMLVKGIGPKTFENLKPYLKELK